MNREPKSQPVHCGQTLAGNTELVEAEACQRCRAWLLIVGHSKIERTVVWYSRGGTTRRRGTGDGLATMDRNGDELELGCDTSRA
jgi:hypothetical protein